MVEQLVGLFAAFASGGYDWDEFYVYKHPRERGKYIVDSDSGCSCNHYEPPTLDQAASMTPMGKREVYKAFSEWFSEGGYRERHGTMIDNMERLRSAL